MQKASNSATGRKNKNSSAQQTAVNSNFYKI